MKLKDLVEQYGEYEVEEWFEIGTDGVADEKGIKLKKPKHKTVWDLEVGDSIVTINCDGFIEDDKWYDCFDDERDNGNVFLTYEDAVTERERRQVETLLLKYGGRRWFKKDVWNYFLVLNDVYEAIGVRCAKLSHTQGTIFFDTEEQAKKAVKEIGEERIKKALFEVR